MYNQSVFNIGHSSLYFDSSLIEGFDINKEYIIKFEKKSCKTLFFESKIEVCGCRIEFKICIHNCIEKGKWAIYIIESEKIKHQNAVTVY